MNPANGSLSVMKRIYDEETGEQWYEMTDMTKQALNISPKRHKRDISNLPESRL